MPSTFRNIGSTERVVRIAVGVALITVAIVFPGAWWGYIGIVPLITGTVGWCPLYSLVAMARRNRVAR